MNIYETLHNAAKTWPDRLAVRDAHGPLTYKELFQQTEQLRIYLEAEGVAKNTGIALIAGNSRYFIIGLYASVGCGAVVMPVSPQQQPAEIRGAIDAGQLHFILSDENLYSEFGKDQATVDLFSQELFLSRTGRDRSEVTVPFVADPAFMRFTSGTTGTAKCVILSHQAALERTEAANEALKITADDNVIWVLPMAYHFIVSIVLYIRYGAGIIICEDFLAEHLLGKIQNHRGTFLYASPMHIRLLAGYKESIPLPSLRSVISTTTAVNPEHCKAFLEKYKLPVQQAFGIIEIGLPVINTAEAEQHPEAIGRALPAYQVAILDDNFKTLPYETMGLLAIKGPGMFEGYLSPPTLRSDILKDGWFITGDYATSSADGLITLKGREKSMINVSGNKVFPDEVEGILNTHESVQQSKVYGQQHPLFGEIVAADVILKKDFDLDEEELIRYCRKSLSAFKIPQRITAVDKIEVTGSGKIKRN